ncbi:Haloacid dehalogenase-like hydrolase-domain-containing protein [Mycena latifolia]|nr:Haloacid dehalogenase-like hydrolase-domain-containing protein [Mycena latifolia]
MDVNSFNAIILSLDIGDVLLSWSGHTDPTISSQTLKRFLGSRTWFEYERGQISQDLCYETLGGEFSFPPLDVRNAFENARRSLACDQDLVNFFRFLKTESHGSLQVFAMSNISHTDYLALEDGPANWAIFDGIFTSSGAHERKPDLSFYQHVLSETGLTPHRTVFIDDKLDNIVSARSVGLHGIRYENAPALRRVLLNLFGDPILRGRQFLQTHAGRLSSVTPEGLGIHENFAQLLTLEVTQDQSLVNLAAHPRTWNFFQGSPPATLTTDVFPPDLDTTSLALSIIKPDAATVHSVMDEMLEYVNTDGIVQSYFDHTRPRIDPVAPPLNGCTTYSSTAHVDGTRYYLTGECFLYFLMRLLQHSNDPDLASMFQPLLKERVEEVVGTPGDALALAMRVLVCHYVGTGSKRDLDTLISLQCEDGGWEAGLIYKFGMSGPKMGNRGLTTALAIKGVEASSN